MEKRRKLTEDDWRAVFRLRCKSKSGGVLTGDEMALIAAAYEADPKRYGDAEADVFNATVPFGSNVRMKTRKRRTRP